MQPEWKKVGVPLRRPSVEWKDNISMDPKEVVINMRKLVDSAHVRDY